MTVARKKDKPSRTFEAWRRRYIRPVNSVAVIMDNFVVR